MAIIKQIDKYLDYYNRYIAQSMQIAEKTTELLRKKKVEELGAETIESLGNAKDEKQVIDIMQKQLKTAFESGVGYEVAPIIQTAAGLQKGEIETEKAGKLYEQSFKSLNPDDYRVVGGQLMKVKDILSSMDLPDTESKVKFINSLQQPKVERGIGLQSNELKVMYADNTGKILKESVYPIVKQDGKLGYIDEVKQFRSLTPEEEKAILNYQMNKQELSMKAEELNLRKATQERAESYNQIDKLLTIVEKTQKNIQDTYVTYRLKQWAEQEGKDLGNLDPESTMEANIKRTQFEKEFNVTTMEEILNNEKFKTTLKQFNPNIEKEIISYKDNYNAVQDKIAITTLYGKKDPLFVNNYDEIREKVKTELTIKRSNNTLTNDEKLIYEIINNDQGSNEKRIKAIYDYYNKKLNKR